MTMDLQHAAAFLKVSEDYLAGKARSGKIKASKPGRRWVFQEKDLKEYLDRDAELQTAMRKFQPKKRKRRALPTLGGTT